MEEAQKSREEIFSESIFEWIKTERSGDISKFKCFEVQEDVEYVKFEDDTRIRTDLLGDIVLVHQHAEQILGANVTFENRPQQPYTQPQYTQPTQQQYAPSVIQTPRDPVLAILDKSKKRNEKITLSLTIKIPSLDLYGILRENFSNVDDILITSVLEQIQEKTLRDAVKKELQNLYQKNKK